MEDGCDRKVLRCGAGGGHQQEALKKQCVLYTG
jgi:hypothetical protein